MLNTLCLHSIKGMCRNGPMRYRMGESDLNGTGISRWASVFSSSWRLFRLPGADKCNVLDAAAFQQALC